MRPNLSPYEQNWLRKFRVPEEKWSQIGEEPVEYVTGWAEFDNHLFKVNHDVLIPRIESMDIVNMAEKILDSKENASVADVGTGSGALGIAVYLRRKKVNKKTDLVMSDISQSAIEVAHENWRLLAGDEKVEILVSDLMSGYHKKKFDLIMGNLPYIPSFRIKGLPESVVDYEPHLALDGGKEGLEIIFRFLAQAKDYLTADGSIILEIDYAHTIEDFVNKGFSKVEIVKDEFGQRRFVILGIPL